MFDLPQQPISHYEQVVNNATVTQKAIESMRSCDGWCSERKGTYLVDLVLKMKPRVVVEVGVYGGKSFVPMAVALKANAQGVAYGIDPWDSVESLKEVQVEGSREFWGRVDHQQIKETLIKNIHRFDLDDQVRLIESTSENAPPIFGIDLLHIDGNHSEKMSYGDVQKWVPYVNSGGMIILDDTTWSENGVYTQAKSVRWLDTNCRRVDEIHDEGNTWGVWVKP